MNRKLEEEIIEEIIRNESRAGRGAEEPCCPGLLEQPWPAWVPDLARRSPEEALQLLGSGWGGLAPGHAEAHLKRLGLNSQAEEPGQGWRGRWRFGPARPQVFVIRGRGDRGSGSAWIPAEFLAPGDLILLSEGERVPADVRLLRTREFRVDEEVLTGDPRPVAKAPDWVGSPGPADPMAIPDLCFCGSRVVGGTATAMVVATGKRTLGAMLRAS